MLITIAKQLLSLDATCFSISLSDRRNRRFYTYRQLCQYLHKLARRCASAKGTPSGDKWPEVLDLELKRVTALIVSDSMTRIKLSEKLDIACNTKAEREVKGKHGEGSPLDALTSKNKEDFGRSARS